MLYFGAIRFSSFRPALPKPSLTVTMPTLVMPFFFIKA